MKPGTVQSSSDLEFRARSGSSLYFSTMLDLWWSTFCERRQQWPAASTQEQYCQKLLRLSRSSDQTWEPQGHYYSMTMLLRPHKATATVQYLEGEKLQVLPHPPYIPDYWLLSTLKTSLAEKNFFTNSRLQEWWIHNFMSYPVWSTTMPSRNG